MQITPDELSQPVQVLKLLPPLVEAAVNVTAVLLLYVRVNEVVPLPWLLLSFGVTAIETPLFGLEEAILSVLVVDVTVKDTPLLAIPPEVTTTLPVVAPFGTTATIDVELQLIIDVATEPAKLTVLAPCVEPKLLPVIVTELPTGPEVGERPAIEGGELFRPAKVMSLRVGIRAGIWPEAELVSWTRYWI